MKIRRILVAVDASPHSLAALEASAELAAALGARLEGLFVEDEDLHNLTRLPFAREVDSSSGETRRLRPQDVERHLRRQAEIVRRSVQWEAHRRRIGWSFQTSRGPVTSTIREAAANADLVVLGVRGRTPTSGLGSTARALVSSEVRVMVLRHEARLDQGVGVVFDDSKAAVEALALGRMIAAERRVGLVVFLLGGDDPDPVREALRRELAGGYPPPRVVALDRRDPRTMAAALRRRSPGLVIMPRSALGADDARNRFLDAMDGPVLLVG